MFFQYSCLEKGGITYLLLMIFRAHKKTSTFSNKSGSGVSWIMLLMWKMYLWNSEFLKNNRKKIEFVFSERQTDVYVYRMTDRKFETW